MATSSNLAACHRRITSELHDLGRDVRHDLQFLQVTVHTGMGEVLSEHTEFSLLLLLQEQALALMYLALQDQVHDMQRHQNNGQRGLIERLDRLEYSVSQIMQVLQMVINGGGAQAGGAMMTPQTSRVSAGQMLVVQQPAGNGSSLPALVSMPMALQGGAGRRMTSVQVLGGQMRFGSKEQMRMA
jgi:hypothetical protein